MPGIIYKFKNQNVQTFEDNYKFMGEAPFLVYFDFDVTFGKRSLEFDDEEKNDCAKRFTKLKEKYSRSKMFPCQLKLVIEICKRWIDEKFKRKYRDVDLFSKQIYQK